MIWREVSRLHSMSELFPVLTNKHVIYPIPVIISFLLSKGGCVMNSRKVNSFLKSIINLRSISPFLILPRFISNLLVLSIASPKFLVVSSKYHNANQLLVQASRTFHNVFLSVVVVLYVGTRKIIHKKVNTLWANSNKKGRINTCHNRSSI